MIDSTVKYYDDNARLYYEDTVAADMSEVYQPFLDLLPAEAKVLDAGCGSGRDSLFFRNLGFEVEAFDASEAMVRLSSELLGQEVKLLRFEEPHYPSCMMASGPVLRYCMSIGKTWFRL